MGAAFNGEYFVGLGDTQEEAFEAYLRKVSGVAPTITTPDMDYVELLRDDRIGVIQSTFEENKITVGEPTSIQIPISFNEGHTFFFTEDEREEVEEFILEFIDNFVKPRTDRVFMWEDEPNINIGTVYLRDGIAEMPLYLDRGRQLVASCCR